MNVMELHDHLVGDHYLSDVDLRKMTAFHLKRIHDWCHRCEPGESFTDSFGNVWAGPDHTHSASAVSKEVAR